MEAERALENNEENRINALANITNAIGHPIRIRIVRILAKNKDASWSQLNKELETELGHLNPNTVSFHLSKLIIAGLIEKKNDNRYSIHFPTDDGDLLKPILSMLK